MIAFRMRRQLEPDLALVVRGEDRDDAVDALGGVQRVQGAEDEVARLGGQQGRIDGVQVAHLAHQDDVGVLAEAGAQAPREGRDVHPDLPLADGALLVLVEVLDGVLDGDDVLPAVGVDVVEHGGQRGRLAAPGRPGDEDEAALVEGDLFQDLGQEELADRLDLERDDAEGDGQRAALVEDASPEAAEALQAVGQVEVQVLLEALLLVIRHHLARQFLGVLGREPGEAGQRRQCPVDPDHRVVPRLQVNVRSVPLDGDLQEFIDDHGRLLDPGIVRDMSTNGACPRGPR